MSGIHKREREQKPKPETDSMARLKMIGDEAGVSGNELADYLRTNETIELAISRMEEREDKNKNLCMNVYLIGEEFNGRTVTQKYTATQARELYDAFLAIDPEYGKGKQIEGSVFEWTLTIQPGTTQFPRLRPTKLVQS